MNPWMAYVNACNLRITSRASCSRCPTWHRHRRRVRRLQLPALLTTDRSRPLRSITHSSSAVIQGPVPSSSTSSRPSCTSWMWVPLLQMDSVPWYGLRRMSDDVLDLVFHNFDIPVLVHSIIEGIWLVLPIALPHRGEPARNLSSTTDERYGRSPDVR